MPPTRSPSRSATCTARPVASPSAPRSRSPPRLCDPGETTGRDVALPEWPESPPFFGQNSGNCGDDGLPGIGMIALLRGNLIEKHPSRLIVDVGGVGYDVQVPLSTFYVVGDPGADVTLRVHTHVREDVI